MDTQNTSLSVNAKWVLTKMLEKRFQLKGNRKNIIEEMKEIEKIQTPDHKYTAALVVQQTSISLNVNCRFVKL